MSKLIDTHCHLDAQEFNQDREKVICRAKAQGIDHFLVPGIQPKGWKGILDLSRKHPEISAGLGIHPWYIDDQTDNHLERLLRIMKTTPLAGIGECGLDFIKARCSRKKQTEVFIKQIEIACIYNVPIIIHAVKSIDQVIHILKNYPTSTGVFHSFSGSVEQAQQVIALGFYLGIGNKYTFPSRKKELIIKEIPLQHLVLETDSPFQSGIHHRNERNEPAFLTEILPVITKIKKIESHEVATQTTKNVKNLFCF